MIAARIIAALITCGAGMLVSGRLIFLLTRHEQVLKTIDFVILGAVALAALLAAFAVPFLTFYSLAMEVR